jgi:5-methyltetrahydrofolate--homocysteine methyltransferase
MTMINRFTTKYRGRRYSFGYPACPALEDRVGIWKRSREGNAEMTLRRFNARRVRRAGSESHQLLKPEEIGVQLTEGFMNGSGGECQRAGVSPSRLHVLWSWRCV